MVNCFLAIGATAVTKYAHCDREQKQKCWRFKIHSTAMQQSNPNTWYHGNEYFVAIAPKWEEALVVVIAQAFAFMRKIYGCVSNGRCC
jgi:hypothetical protein